MTRRCNMLSARTLAFLALLSVWMAVPACALTGSPTAPVPGPGPGEGDPGFPASFSACTTDAVKREAGNIINDVTSALVVEGYNAALDVVKAEVAKKAPDTAGDIVKCAVQSVVDSLTHKAKADDLSAAELARGQAWLASH